MNPPTAQNPIVGRIAFWTDDDTCKVNINTACEGTSWEMPVGTTLTDRDYAFRIPGQNEYARFPGHPAATCLSPIFQAFDPVFFIDPAKPAADSLAAHQFYHQISPGYVWEADDKSGTKAGTGPPSSEAPPNKRERLYAGVDELFFDRDRNPHSDRMDRADLDVAKFFLTAHSRAPELNAFGKPRISLWPFSSAKAERNARDKLMAFMAGTTGDPNRVWGIQRNRNFKSATDPGSSQHPTTDYVSGGRNAAMYEAYLRPLTGSTAGSVTYTFPGFRRTAGSTAETHRVKYGAAQWDQSLTTWIDLLRWGVNSSVTTTTINGSSGQPTYSYLPPRNASNPGNKGQSSAVPLDITVSPGTRGFGRWPTITEAVLVFMRAEPPANAPPGDTYVQAFLILETFNPAPGPASTTPNIIYRVEGLENFKIGAKSADTDMGFPGPLTNAKPENLCQASDANAGGPSCGSTAFASLGSQFAAAGSTGAARTSKKWNPTTPGTAVAIGDYYPFVSAKIKFTGSEIKFNGGTLTVKTYPGWTGQTSGAPLVQTITLSFPAATLPKPNPSTFMNVDDRLQPTKLQDRLILPEDVTRSVEARMDGTTLGDLRLHSVKKSIPASWFAAHPKYNDPAVRQLHFLRCGTYTSSGQFGSFAKFPALTPPSLGAQNGRPSTHDTAGTLVANVTYSKVCPPAVPRGLAAALKTDGRPGDWDNGTGILEDGPYIRKPDEGNLASGTTSSPYLDRHLFNVETGTTYSPNRQICSAVAFGSLPTGIHPANNVNGFSPWQTLLFCPNPPSRTQPAGVEPAATDHKGFGNPRDHLLLDLFWMPVTEPYAISEPLSTAGKVNMNCQMVPFTHIERSSGLHAVLKSTRLTAITPASVGSAQPLDGTGYNKSGAQVCKAESQGAANATPHQYEMRYTVNAAETLQGFRSRFAQGDVFRSASEICEIFLVPRRLELPGRDYAPDAKVPPQKYEDVLEWWNGDLTDLSKPDAFEMTGDNSREAPYNHLYPRLTTKSNTYTVHYRVQVLKKARSSPVAEWVEAKDRVAGEYRGSTSMERYLDPNDVEVGPLMVGGADFATGYWEKFYRMRILNRKQFLP